MNQSTETPFLGLAPFLRLSIAGGDLRQVTQDLLAQAQQEPDNANLWLNLSTAFFALAQREMGLLIQGQALQMQRLYALPAARQPARCRVLMLMAAGDLAENTPLDCLLEDSDVDLLFYYATAEQPLPYAFPEHDAVVVAISDTRDNRPLLDALVPLLRFWPQPVINVPQHIPHTERSAASDLLQQVPGLLMPPTRAVTRATLVSIVAGQTGVEAVLPGGAFPIILRPLGSHAGRDLARLENPAAVADYLSKVADAEFFISRFIDYSGADGLFRKFRIALIDGQPFASHMGISANWMIHYVNAGMYDDAAKRAEEAAFMANFAAFAAKHAVALRAVHERIGLDYVCIDCAETREGELLIFEVDHAMVVHAMDPDDLFPYKKVHMLMVQTAFEQFLQRRLAART